jgi:hypothetical protein
MSIGNFFALGLHQHNIFINQYTGRNDAIEAHVLLKPAIDKTSFTG